MIIEKTKDGRSVTHPTGIMVLESKEQLEQRASFMQGKIGRLQSEVTELDFDILEIAALEN